MRGIEAFSPFPHSPLLYPLRGKKKKLPLTCWWSFGTWFSTISKFLTGFSGPRHLLWLCVLVGGLQGKREESQQRAELCFATPHSVPPAPHLCPTGKPWASPGWKVFIFDAVVAPQWLSQKSLGCQNGWKVVLWGLSYSCAYRGAYGLGSDSVSVVGWVGGQD